MPLLVFGLGAALFVTGAAAVGTWSVAQLGAGGEGVAEFIDQAHRVGLPVSGVGFILVDLGFICLAIAVKRSGTLTQGQAWTVIAALVVSVLAGFIPAGWAGFVLAGGILIALWLIGSQMWRAATATLGSTSG